MVANIFNKFPSKNLRASDFEGETEMTIDVVVDEEVGQGENAEVKPVLYFAEDKRGLVLNKTNATTIASLYGPDTDDWVGKKVILFPTEVDFGGKMVEAVRVRKRVPGSERRPVGRDPVAGRGQPAPAQQQAARRQAPAQPVDDDEDVPF